MSSSKPRDWVVPSSLLVPLVLPLVFVVGCAQVPSTPPVVVECTTPTDSRRTGPALVGQTYGMAMTPIPLNSVQFGSVELARTMAIQGLHASRSPTDTVRLQVRVVSCADQPTQVRMRTSFLRSDSAPAEPPSAWKVVFLSPRATALYDEHSIARDAASYMVEVSR